MTAAELAIELRADVGTATRLLSVTEALVERYAPDAPEPIKNEAIIRSAGWLHQVAPTNVRRKQIGEVTIERVPSMASQNPLRASGALAILGPYRKLRAGAIKAATA